MSRNDTIDALEEVWRGVAEVTDGLTEAQWSTPTGCPGWTVKDNVAHIAGLESSLAGRARPDHVPADAAHVRNDLGRMMEVDVDARRGLPGEAVRAELVEVTSLRLTQLRALDDAGWEAEIEGPFGPTSNARFMGIRVFDCLAHEQDVRRALGRPGNLDGKAGRIVAGRIRRSLPFVLPDAVDEPVTVAIDVTGPHPSRTVVRVDGEPATVRPDDDEADVELRLDLATLVALACGRADTDRLAITVTGDPKVASQVMDGLTMTP